MNVYLGTEFIHNSICLYFSDGNPTVTHTSPIEISSRCKYEGLWPMTVSVFSINLITIFLPKAEREWNMSFKLYMFGFYSCYLKVPFQNFLTG